MSSVPPKSTIINICIMPSAKVCSQCVQLSQSLKSEGTIFTLDGINRFAHMTVFMARFADSEVPNVLQVTEQALSDIPAFLCEHTGYFMTAGRYLEVSYRKSVEFIALHELFINVLSRYRFNPGNPVEEDYFAPYTEEQRQNAKETGYDLAHNLYRPHITLTRYKEGCLPEIFPGFAPAKLSFMLNEIGVYKADNNGAIYEVLREFSL
jgi:hypothetical protein